ncbi:ribose-phosphate pyrophosphokinase Prs [Thermoclostridium stercorarium subsp. stercorarium DSM 8532]|uniref:ribose-phosphate diphosphokinase n=2 Tax=Thermoclostridium stercorarium TaxID=1510 RepID=L7VS36_THES1|nr:ribose-phosphate pyrophosphokinase [Thermoclostridium stercorarium]AGC68393.1 ribose-phosphate pyrophosphokinase Prs [Thermoclostridium stercorarium subsp. stercorarium DSM 8532]AGI39413.1 ribose-phosphate pyrophosphokinase [Thermoclostridium stercorarium subsp. stercorarium DSM 8532]ANW98753.1 ribose-phosphate pyrophosphokinase [Thermoclostridium stercorarium subsp. thermolacticum DSM 2910]UZQ86896.1 ribose-phosphate pyrophosphokinase [Thermoclostridium stercorarium]
MPGDETEIKIFAGSSSINFAEKMCKYLGTELGKSQAIKFSEGNTFVKILEKVRDKDVYIVQTIGLNPNDDFMELLFWIDAFKRSSAASVTAIIPYFSYAKGDKKDEPRVSIRARVCADCLEITGVDRIVTMDLHSPQIQGFFKKPVDHLYGFPILCEYIKSKNIENTVVVSPDAGFAKNARKIATILKAPVAIGDKIRTDHNEKAQVLEIIGDVKGKNAIIVDDFTISCGTLIDTARALKENGAEKIYACVTHALLREKGLKALEESDIEELIVTDTVENPMVSGHPKIKVVSVAPLFAEAVKIIHNRESLSRLFDNI